MTTKAAETMYEQQHLSEWKDKSWAVYNPQNKPLSELPTIYGFNNGGKRPFYEARLVSEDGIDLGSHGCTSEAYMPADLGVLEGSAPSRHQFFRCHYPNGYKMEFVGYDDVQGHDKLMTAIKRCLKMQTFSKESGE
jgi:hypothetical protein